MARWSMRCETTPDADAFWELAGDFLLSDPVRHNMLVTNVESRRRGIVVDEQPPTFAAVIDGSTVVGAAMRTRPFPLTITPMSQEAADTLADGLWPECADAKGVSGPSDLVGGFASRWGRQAGRALTVASRQRLHRLDEVNPQVSPGEWRLATPDDRELLIAWSDAFDNDIGLRREHDPGPIVDDKIATGRAFLWVDGGVPVSYTGTQPPVAGVARVGPVYTPAELRGRGYASALVAAVSQHQLDNGSTACALYTDLANPTSNKIYAAIGYEPVMDVDVYLFDAA